MRIARVFPRKTTLSPTDELAYFDVPGMFDEADEVHVSTAFSWDMERSEYLAEQWRHVAPVKMGGPAHLEAGGDFVPGKYVRPGIVVTSRGCSNKCWFCTVWKREPKLVELPICEGTDIIDDNLLACSEKHIRAVFAMLESQKGKWGKIQVGFYGGFEAAILKPWHVDLLVKLRPGYMFFAFDTPDDEEPLREASKMLLDTHFTRKHLRCYVLIGYPKDTFDAAEDRLRLCVELGFFPYAMLYRGKSGYRDPEWVRFQRKWIRPALIGREYKAADRRRGLTKPGEVAPDPVVPGIGTPYDML